MPVVIRFVRLFVLCSETVWGQSLEKLSTVLLVCESEAKNHSYTASKKY
jgi:hypothetical protein